MVTARRSAFLLLFGVGITDLSFRVAQVAVPLVVLAGTGSVAATGLVAGASGLPVLLSPWWTRRLRHRIAGGRAVAACYLGEAAALAAVAGARRSTRSRSRCWRRQVSGWAAPRL